MIALERAYDYSLAVQYVYYDQSDACVWEITLYTYWTDWSEYSECEESVTDVDICLHSTLDICLHSTLVIIDLQRL